jgi:wyosine [tRNA(Phe)-imidazoG37] synthetase (radical SAM superfamily)
LTKKYRHLYGPVPSRRLGRSLGIDLVPPKICTYDCVYCQIGQTAERRLVRKEYIPREEVLEEVRTFLEGGGSPIDHFSLSGSGEPTLHSGIRWVIDEIKKLSSIPVAVITNGSLLYREDVREDLLRADVVLPSLDAVSPEVFQKINRPHPEVTVEKVIEGLVEFRKVYRGKIWLEVLFCKGINNHPGEIEKMKEAIDRIQPDRIDLNTVVRPPAEKWASPLSHAELEKVRAFLGEKAIVIPEFDRHPLSVPGQEVQERIVSILGRRPLSLADLSKWMRIPQHELETYLTPLIREGKVKTRSFGGSVYFEIAGDSPSSNGKV